MKLKTKNWKLETGLTLIEILISMAIFAGAMIFITRFSLDIAGYSVFFGESLAVQQEITQSLKVMSAEFRSMGPADTGAYPIAVAAGNTVTFYSDYDGDGKFEQIRYYMTGTTLMRGVTKSSGSPAQYLPANEVSREVVHDVVSNPDTIFSYYPKEYTVTQTPLPSPVNIPSIRLMSATVSADQKTKGGPGTATETITITIRNFRTLQ